MELIDKSALVAEIEKLKAYLQIPNAQLEAIKVCDNIISVINTLEVKEVDEQKERISECPYRQVGCTMYEGHILECKGACSWVVDYPKLKELKSQKGE